MRMVNKVPRWGRSPSKISPIKIQYFVFLAQTTTGILSLHLVQIFRPVSKKRAVHKDGVDRVCRFALSANFLTPFSCRCNMRLAVSVANYYTMLTVRFHKCMPGRVSV
jgi:hypothetical protein